MKPILFNTEMVQAILEGRKTATRRLVKPRYSDSVFERFKGRLCEASPFREPERLEDGRTRQFVRRYVPCKPPCKEGDVLWVRETWAHPSQTETEAGTDPNLYLYKADRLRVAAWGKWCPSIHMPKEAARLFLQVTAVRAELLQDITVEGTWNEGADPYNPGVAGYEKWDVFGAFAALWDSTIKPADLGRFGWEANPWVWVIEFERISKEVAQREEGQGHERLLDSNEN